MYRYHIYLFYVLLSFASGLVSCIIVFFAYRRGRRFLRYYLPVAFVLTVKIFLFMAQYYVAYNLDGGDVSSIFIFFAAVDFFCMTVLVAAIPLFVPTRNIGACSHSSER